jgi:orotate phosphoribosyltransferase
MEWNREKQDLGKKIIKDLYEFGIIKTWQRDKKDGWILVSGIWSPFYIQLRKICSHPKLLKNVGYAMGKMIEHECRGDKLLGIAMAGIPIATAISLAMNIPICFTRKMEGVRSSSDFKKKVISYGEHALIEGEINEGDAFVAIDDLVTEFNSKMVAFEQLGWEAQKRDISVSCNEVAVLIDREQGAEKTAQKFGKNLYSLIPFKSKGLEWLREYLTKIEYEVLSDYLIQPEKYQDPKIHSRLKNI